MSPGTSTIGNGPVIALSVGTLNHFRSNSLPSAELHSRSTRSRCIFGTPRILAQSLAVSHIYNSQLLKLQSTIFIRDIFLVIGFVCAVSNFLNFLGGKHVSALFWRPLGVIDLCCHQASSQSHSFGTLPAIDWMLASSAARRRLARVDLRHCAEDPLRSKGGSRGAWPRLHKREHRV